MATLIVRKTREVPSQTVKFQIEADLNTVRVYANTRLCHITHYSRMDQYPWYRPEAACAYFNKIHKKRLHGSARFSIAKFIQCLEKRTFARVTNIGAQLEAHTWRLRSRDGARQATESKEDGSWHMHRSAFGCLPYNNPFLVENVYIKLDILLHLMIFILCWRTERKQQKTHDCQCFTDDYFHSMLIKLISYISLSIVKYQTTTATLSQWYTWFVSRCYSPHVQVKSARKQD